MGFEMSPFQVSRQLVRLASLTVSTQEYICWYIHEHTRIATYIVQDRDVRTRTTCWYTHHVVHVRRRCFALKY